MSANSYTSVLPLFGYDIAAEEDLGDYQGDWVGLIKRNYDANYGFPEWGFLVVGYGSCSGCDAWQAADTPAETAQIIKDMFEAAKWFADLDEAKSHIVNTPMTELQWYGHEDGWLKFVQAVTAVSE